MTDYPYTNEDPNSLRHGQHYYEKAVTVNGVPGEEHVYEDGATEFVPNPAGPNTNVESTGGVANVPVAPAPAAAAPAPTTTSQPAAPPQASVNAQNNNNVEETTSTGIQPLNSHYQPLAGPQAGTQNAPDVMTTGSISSPSPSPSEPAAPPQASVNAQNNNNIEETTSGGIQPLNSNYQPLAGPQAGTQNAPDVMSTGSGSTNTIIIKSGDTFWGLENENGWAHGTLEQLNPGDNPHDLQVGTTIKVPSGGTSTAESTPAVTPPEVTAVTSQGSSTPHEPAADGGIGTGGAAAPGAIGFPEKSTYPPVGDNVDKVGDGLSSIKAEGWVDGSGNSTPDVAKQVFEADTQTSTDPLKINEKK